MEIVALYLSLCFLFYFVIYQNITKKIEMNPSKTHIGSNPANQLRGKKKL